MSKTYETLEDMIAKAQLTWHWEWARASNNIQWNLYRLREFKGWTQEELARRMGVAQSNIARHEAGYVPSLNTLAKYAHAYRLSVADIVGEPIHKDPHRLLNDAGEVIGQYSTKSASQTITKSMSFA